MPVRNRPHSLSMHSRKVRAALAVRDANISLENQCPSVNRFGQRCKSAADHNGYCWNHATGKTNNAGLHPGRRIRSTPPTRPGKLD